MTWRVAPATAKFDREDSIAGERMSPVNPCPIIKIERKLPWMAEMEPRCRAAPDQDLIGSCATVLDRFVDALRWR